MWGHGASAQFDIKTWETRATRQGFYTTVFPSADAISGWVSIPIPTPAIVNDVRLRPQIAIVRLNTGPKASIGAVHAHDGEFKIVDINGKTYKGQPCIIREPVLANTPEIRAGANISIFVVFEGNVSDAWVQLIGAGIEFA